MTKSKKNRPNPRRRASLARNRDSPPDNVTVYRGPIQANPVQDGIVVTLNDTDNFALTNGAMVTTVIVPSNPTGSVGFSAFAGLYREYRVLAMECTYIPFQTALSIFNLDLISTGYFPTSPLQSVVVHDAESPSTVADWLGQTSFQMSPLNQTKRRVARMSAVEESDFIETDAPINTFSIGFSVDYTESQDGSHNIATVLTKRKIQFRTKWTSNSMLRNVSLISSNDEKEKQLKKIGITKPEKWLALDPKIKALVLDMVN